MLNFSEEPQTVRLQRDDLGELSARRVRALFSSTAGKGEHHTLEAIELAPFEIFIAELA